jgi:hypothetical protein
MRKFILIMFITVSLFAIDTCYISVSSTSPLYRLWSDTYIWIRGADDSLLILTDDTTSFDITAWDDLSVVGVDGWDTVLTYYQTANIEADFASLETWDSLQTVLDSASAPLPQIKVDLSAITPTRLIRFLAIAQDSVADTTGATIDFQMLGK